MYFLFLLEFSLFLSYGRILTYYFYFLLMCILFSFLFPVLHHLTISLLLCSLWMAERIPCLTLVTHRLSTKALSLMSCRICQRDVSSVLCALGNDREMSPGNDFINTTYDISLDSRTSDRCSKRILSVFWTPSLTSYKQLSIHFLRSKLRFK